MATEEVTYGTWAQHHATVFAFGEAARASLQAWLPLLKRAGYHPAELLMATDWLAMNDPPGFPADHLRALHRAVREVRALEVPTEQPWDRGACSRCGDTGRLVVPHLRCVQGEQWLPLRVARGGASYYTQAVRCDCARGRFGRFDARDGTSLANLEEYATRNPHWQQQLAHRAREVRAIHDADADLGTALDLVMARLRQQQRQPGEDDE